LNGVPAHMPALLQALRISQKAVAQGFEWPEEDGVWQQLASELAEFKEAANEIERQKALGQSPRLDELDLEMGDVIFTLVNLGRWHGLNPEESLLRSIAKFKERFTYMEKTSGRPLKELSVTELEALWSQAKCKGG